MDPGTRKAIQARDGAVARMNKVTWRIGTASFAHLLPTHLPTFGIGRDAECW